MLKDIVNYQFQRQFFETLNGEWFFVCDEANISSIINVPYAPESILSGIGYKSFMKHCSYKKTFFLNPEKLNFNVLLRFEFVDWEAMIYVNGKYVGNHKGGYTSFFFDITKFCVLGDNEIRVEVFDDISLHHASGKQSTREESFGCFYTRTTGIYGNVTLEFVPNNYVKSFLIDGDIDNCSVTIDLNVVGKQDLFVNIKYKEKVVGYYSEYFFSGGKIEIKLSEKHLWEIGKGELYDVQIDFGKDSVKSYFGLRKCEYKNGEFYLNNKKIFQLLVLDQGFYKDGIYTPKNITEATQDIDLAIKLGFNGARLHQRVFNNAYLHEADKKGFIVWQEYGSWGLINSSLVNIEQFEDEWKEAMLQTYNHPCIVTWCPLNEAWKDFTDEAKIRDKKYLERIYDLSKSIDRNRPIIDASGGFHTSKNDIADFHCYEKSEKMTQALKEINKTPKAIDNIEPAAYLKNEEINHDHLPIILSEFGGMSFGEKRETNGWGYNNYSNPIEFIDEYIRLIEAIIDCPKIVGCCYTQLFDVEQEQNGFYTFERKPKFSKELFNKVLNINKKLLEVKQ